MYKETQVKVVNPLYAVGAAWLVYGLIFPLYRLTDLLIAAAVSVLAFITAKRFIPERTVVTPLTASGGRDHRCLEMIDRGYGYIKELEGFNSLIKDDAMTRHIGEITAVSRQMFDYAAKNPTVAIELRNFIDYYYPTTIKLLSTYADMREQAMETGKVADIMGKVHNVMGTVSAAFKKQLDMLYGDKQLDISTDIQVLKSALAAEGLTGI